MEKKSNVADETFFQRDMLVQQKLEQLRIEYGKLHEQKIATDRDRKNLEEQLRILREKAEREYGTSDIEQLKALLEQRRLENDRMVEEYEKHIEGIKQGLAAVEKGETKEV